MCVCVTHETLNNDNNNFKLIFYSTCSTVYSIEHSYLLANISHIYIYIYIYMCVCVYECIPICILYIYIYIYIYIHTHIFNQ